MYKKRVIFTLACALFINSQLVAKTQKKVSKKKQNKKKIESPLVEPLKTEIEVAKPVLSTTHNYQINTMFGINVVKGSALFFGVQFGKRLGPTVPLFAGLEYGFSLYSPGSILGILGGGWYEIPIEHSQGSSLIIGTMAGSGFTTDVIGTPTTAFLAFLDLVYSQPMDDLFSLRIQLRPGVMHKYIAFMMNLSVAFRL